MAQRRNGLRLLQLRTRPAQRPAVRRRVVRRTRLMAVPPLHLGQSRVRTQLGSSPKCVVTTTPKPIKLLRELTTRKDVEITTGSSYDNSRNLPPGFIDSIAGRYEGTNTGLQEIYAQLLKEADGALWKREWIDDHRLDSAPDDIRMKAVAIDPAVTFNPNRSDETGIIVAGISRRRTETRP